MSPIIRWAHNAKRGLLRCKRIAPEEFCIGWPDLVEWAPVDRLWQGPRNLAVVPFLPRHLMEIHRFRQKGLIALQYHLRR